MRNAVALGTFDGVHCGHRAVLSMPDGYKKIAVTFALPPRAVLSGEAELLNMPEDKLRLLKENGIDEALSLDFLQVRNMPYTDFLQFILKSFNPALISCGFNYCFGKNAEGNTERLADFCRENGIIFKCEAPVTLGSETVSSTYIRSLLREGMVESAAELLSEPFSFKAEVIDGRRQGRTIGFPTVNQKYPEALVRLKFGVYKTEIALGADRYEGITDIGIRPTFRSDYVISETYIKNFSGDLYGKELRIIPKHFLREERKFSSLEEVKQQILIDIKS